MIASPYLIGEQLQIRPLHPTTDLETIATIEQQSFPSPMSAEKFAQHLQQCASCTYFVLEKSGTIIGYIGILLLVDEVHVRIIAVSVDERRNGYGELMLLYSLLWFAPQNPFLATLEVRVNNKTAQQLYKKLQFKQVGIRPRYYRDTGEDAYIMTVPSFNETWLTHLQQLWDAKVTTLAQ